MVPSAQAGGDVMPAKLIAGPPDVPLAQVSPYAMFSFSCEGTLFEVEAEAEVLGPNVNIGDVIEFSLWKTRVYVKWLEYDYSCKATYTIQALGWGGVMRNVRLEVVEGSSAHAIRLCEYSGIVGVPPNGSSCTASYEADNPASSTEGLEGTGIAAPNTPIPHEIQGCVGSWIRGVNDQATLPGVPLLHVVDEYVHAECKTIGINWKTSQASLADELGIPLVLEPVLPA